MTTIVHGKALNWEPFTGPGKFSVDRKPLGANATACNLGCSLYRLEPGNTAFPLHHHSANDEALYVLEGELSLKLGNTVHPMKKGDYATLPACTGIGHQVSNRSEHPVEFLCFSTMEKTDVVFYPNSGKVAINAGVAPGGTAEGWHQQQVIDPKPADYWDGEET